MVGVQATSREKTMCLFYRRACPFVVGDKGKEEKGDDYLVLIHD
jgi:hypothetical protein